MIRILCGVVLCAAVSARAQGMLLPTETGLGPLGIKYQRVSAAIVDGTAVTKVEQVFVNSSPRQLEAHYVFPLPKGAALQDFYLWINGKRTKGEVLEKQKATDIYEGIVRRLQDPGLLEYIDTDAFRARVFPVPANGEQRIELTFSQVLDFQGGVYAYRYPLGASTRGAPKLTVRQDFTFSATISSKAGLRTIYSPTHTMGISRKSDAEAVAGFEQGAGADISKDLALYYSVSDKAVGVTLLSFRPNGDEPGFFTALLSPKTDVKADEVLPKRVTFVMDTSGSMQGDRIKLARESLTYCVQRLNPRDEFNVIRFSTDVEPLFEKPQPATPENIKRAVEFAKGLEAMGGTAIDEALQRALKDAVGKGERPHVVMFITDGQPTVGITDEPDIAKRAKAANTGSRVFTFGVGEDLNARLLDRVAEEGRGASEFLRDGKEFETRVSAFADKIANPVLADVSLDLSAFGAFDVYPKKLPDLFKGTQLVVMGRYRTPKDGTLVLSGTVNGAKKVFEYRAVAAAERTAYDFVPRLWAIRKVGYLLDEIRLNGERPELKDEVVSLGKKYGIVTPYTSYLVVEDTPMPVAQRPMGRPMPTEPLPFGPGGINGFGSIGTRGSGGSAPPPPASAPMREEDLRRKDEKKAMANFTADSLASSEGSSGIAVAKSVRSMKERDSADGDDGSSAVRAASGRTFVSRSGVWVDTEAVNGTPKKLTVKYLSDAYFALLKARPDLKAALALGDRVVVVVAKGASISVERDSGETAADKVTAFLK
ncbi:MAG: VWA domain-containing protein [Archangium sp.]|nr:VWA domain-containing protein [Archangium sp.]